MNTHNLIVQKMYENHKLITRKKHTNKFYMEFS